MHPLQKLVAAQKAGEKLGIYSCCSANEFVLRAAFQRAIENHTTVLIEATANQVNQFGGYTGMTPFDFYEYVNRLATECGISPNQVILGGDHLGPLTWTNLPEAEAMANAEELVRQFVLAGFTKIHLDTSMRLADDDPTGRFPDAVIAYRGARLCRAAEDAFLERRKSVPDAVAPVYIIGSEVPIPGGAQEDEDTVSVTKPADCRNTYQAFLDAFAELGLQSVYPRIVGLVVQPGVEFGEADVFTYDPEKSRELVAVLKELPLVFEGHSTDYQTAEKLRQMVEDGIAILKVGPALTFALREALFSLERMEAELLTGTCPLSGVRSAIEHAMLRDSKNWAKHYHGDLNQQKFARAFSFSDRIRYYLGQPEVTAAVDRLLSNLRGVELPLSLISQYMPMQYMRIRSGKLAAEPEAMLLDQVGYCIDEYLYATIGAERKF